MPELTEPKLNKGRWECDPEGKNRFLAYGSSRHRAQITGTEFDHMGMYSVVLGSELSPEFRFSYQAHAWFLGRAKTLYKEACDGQA